MCLSEYEMAFIESLYNYNRIPLWIYSEEWELLSIFFSENLSSLSKELSFHVSQIAKKSQKPDFDILYFGSELYYIFSFKRNQKTFYCLGGPMLLSDLSPSLRISSFSFSQNMNKKNSAIAINMLPVISFPTFCAFLRITMLILKKTSPSIDEINTYQLSNLQDSMKFTFISELFENREEIRIHSSYQEEMAILNCVKEGDIFRLRATYKALPPFKYGNMSSNPLKLLLYGCIANTTLISRYAIQGGLDEEPAFTLADVYIRQMENCKTAYELTVLNENMAVEFTEKVAQIKQSQNFTYSESISKCMHYIMQNITSKLTLETLASQVHLTPKYLSQLFRKETGQTLNSFIHKKKIEEAKNLLRYTHYTYSYISNYLSFNSQSYFISVFKKEIGMTPNEYRKMEL